MAIDYSTLWNFDIRTSPRKITCKMAVAMLHNLPEKWDLVVIGGGITGAGIFREAVRMGMHVLLVEQMDFSWGTSSRSSKLVHGGLRYLKEGRLHLTKISVEERERLLTEAPGLVDMLGFLLPVYKDQSPGKAALSTGLTIYDMMAREKLHRFLEFDEFSMQLPHVNQKDLTGGFHFFDAQVDDARMVLRLINDAVAEGAIALNYTAVTAINRASENHVTGIVVEDTETHEIKVLETTAVINATGIWAERLHASPDPKRHLRPLRGSHIIFPHWALPVAQAVTLIHPDDQRAVFIIPWEGAILVGTTDLDYDGDINAEPMITEEEITYLMAAIDHYFPSLDISITDCLSTYAGIRPVLSEGILPPSEESRDHVVWIDRGLVTITGGKYTTFRKMAWDALDAVKQFLPLPFFPDTESPVFAPPPALPEDKCGLSTHTWQRLYGRYGAEAEEIVRSAAAEELTPIPGTITLWAEIPFTAQREQVRHLDDLLLRRVRIGLLTREGGIDHLNRIRTLCEPLLPWDNTRWKEEIARYLTLVRTAYFLPHRYIEPVEEKILPYRNIWKRIKNRCRETMIRLRHP